MSKFSGRIGQSAGLTAELDKIANVELPTAPQQDIPPPADPVAPAQDPQVLQDPSQNLQAAEELPSPAVEQLAPEQQLEADLQEQQRQAIPDMRARWQAKQMPDPIASATASAKVDGGIFDRANRMAAAAEAGGISAPVSLRNTPAFQVAERTGGDTNAIVEALEAEQVGTIQSAIAKAGAVDYTDVRNPRVDPDFYKAGSMVTENLVMQMAGGADAEAETVADPISAAQGVDTGFTAGQGKVKQIAKQQGNAQIGQQIAQEYQRLKGKEVPDKIPAKEAEALGDAFKMMWANQNPDLVNVTRDPTNNQKYLELTPTGEDVLAQGGADRKRLFPNPNVRPAKQSLRTGQLPGDIGQNVVRKVQGGVGRQKFGSVLEDAMRNLASVPNVVDSQRLRILYATALPVLQHSQNPKAFQTWQAKINNIGSDKVAKYTAKHGPEVAMAEMQKASQKLANEVRSIAQERKGANFLSYSIQGFQGRISPQQRWFNPTTSKAVRFVTRNAVPSPAKPGSRVDYNLRQMYTMMLVKGGDDVLPEQREIKFEAAAPQLEAWGDRLQEAITMTDQEVESISQAIEQGIPLTDPNFPQVQPLKLDPEKDAELIKMIESKGEDGPHFIDGVIDASKYLKARRKGKTYHSYFNAYIDGKTNGIASNGIQMGISKTAQQTGVLRNSSTDYLDEPGDVRAVLKDTLMEMLDTNGFDGQVSDYSSELTAVARAVYSHRDLNKKTTMTFGYGKEVDTFGQDMYDTAMLLKADPSQIADPKMREEYLASIDTILDVMKQDSKKFGDTLMTIYAPALESVMSPEALEARSIMRSAAVLHAATNQLLAIKGPTDMDLHFGRETRIAEAVETTKYKLRGEDVKGGVQEFTAAHQKKEATSAAARRYTQRDEAGNESISEQAGDYAYGGSVVGPVQALDAATVGLTASGKSWDRLKRSSGGNPYIHTIYDAFKADAMGFDTILDEVNHNWLKTSMDWSYLKETEKATREAMQNWNAEINKRDPKEKLTENERAYMDFILQKHENAEGKPSMKNFYKKIGTAGSFNKRGVKPFEAMKEMADNMRAVGYDWMNPPAEPNVAQLKTFVKTLAKQMESGKRFNDAIKRTEANKAELKKEILEKGYQPKYGKHGKIALQYYAH